MDNGANNYSRFLKGDDEGIVEIIRNYKDGLILYLNSIVHNISIAEELAENTFVKLAIKKPKYREKYSFKTWLYTLGRNIAIDHLRKISVKSEVRIYDRINLSDEEIVEKEYLKNEQKLILNQNIKKLSSDYQQVLFLIFFEELSNSEAAAVMKKNKRQIENLLYNAKKALKSELEKDGFEYEKL